MMRTLFVLLAVLLAAAPALAASNLIVDAAHGGTGGTGGVSGTPFTVTGNGATSPTTVAGQSGEYIDVVAHFGAKGDANQCSDGVVTAGSALISSSCANWSAANVGEAIIVGGVGASGAPMVTTIASVTDAHDAVMAATATYPSTYQRVYMVYPSTPQSGGGSYVPGDTIVLAGATAVIAATVTVKETLVQSATVNAGGSGGTTASGAASGTCVVYGTTGTGDKARLSVTLTSGAISAVNSVDFVGRYLVNPTSLAAEPVTGCSGITGATLAIVMGVRVGVTTGTQGVYSATAATLTQASTSGSGTGAVFTAGWASDALFAYGFDNTTAFKAAQAAAATAFAAGVPATVHIPTGHFLITSPLTTMTRGVSVAGDGSFASVVVTPEGFSGSLLQWSDAWFGSNFPQQNGTVVNLGTIAFGPHLTNLAIAGDVASPTEWTAINMGDWNDYALIENIHTWDVNGPCFSAGRTLNAASASMRESSVFNFRGDQCGAPDTAAFELTAQGVAPDGTNEIDLHTVSLFGTRGRGVVVSNYATNPTSVDRNIDFFGLRVEGYGSTIAVPPRTGDLVVIGDAATAGFTTNVNIYGLRTASENARSAALRISGPNRTNAPSQIYVHGLIGATGWAGADGLAIDAGSGINVVLTGNTATGEKFVVGGNTLTGPTIRLDADPQAIQTWGAFVDPDAVPYFASPMLKYGQPQIGSVSLSSHFGNGTGTFGAQIGPNSVDFNTSLNGSTQGATGSNDTICGGGSNTAAGNSTTVCGGVGNTLTGSRNFGAGVNGGDHNLTGAVVFASGSPSANKGSSELIMPHLFNSGTANPLRLFAGNGSSANGTNCINLPANQSWSGTLVLHATDVTTRGTDYSWTGHIEASRDAFVTNTTVLVTSTPDILSRGTITGSSVAVTADTTNGCVNVTFTKPTSTASDNYTVTGGLYGVWAAQ